MQILAVRDLRCLTPMLMACVLAGCGGSSDAPNHPKRYPVSGTVTYKGSPVEGASVSFVTSAPGGQGAAGLTDAKGVYRLTTFTPQDGALPGDYQVAISKRVVVGADPSYFDEKSPNYGLTPPKGAEGRVEHQVPEKYGNPATSKLTATVQESEQNTINFDLTD